MGGLLTRIPPEILHNILSLIDPADLFVLSRTSRDLHGYVVDNVPLWRDVYLRILDDPLTRNLDWQKELRDLAKLMKICASKGPEKKSELRFVVETVSRLLKNSARVDDVRGNGSGGSGDRVLHKAAEKRRDNSFTRARSRNAELLGDLLGDPSNVDAFLSRSFIFERARALVHQFQDPPSETHQLSAKLHCLYGSVSLSCDPARRRTRSSSATRMYPFACSKVYDLRQYTHLTGWGPFLADGSGKVDWEKLEAILIVLRENIERRDLDQYSVFRHMWNVPFPGSWPGSYHPLPLDRELGPLELQDPYDVSGTWLRMVCFLDYSDFVTVNFPAGDRLSGNVPRPAIDLTEATRLILMKIHVTAVEEPGEDDGQDMPVVHFRGISRSLEINRDENANSDLRGTCRMTREGEVRWTTFSVFNGEERWRSEGIQIGGPRAARGVVGNWFDRDFDPRGPCGPTAFWKISDGEPKSNVSKILYSDFLPLVDFDHDEDQLREEDFDDLEDGFEAVMPELDIFGGVED